MAWHCPTQVYVALCRLSQSSDAAARDAVRQGIDLMIPSLAKASTEPVSAVYGTLTVAGVPLEAAADSLLPKESAASTTASVPSSAVPPGQHTSSPSYARYLKRVLSEDGHATATLVHLLQIIVRNRDLFYPTR